MAVINKATKFQTLKNLDMSTENSNTKQSCTIDSVSPFLKCGWVVEFDNEWAECLLRKDYEIDEELTLERGLLTEEQNKMVSLGQIVKYNKKTKSVQFLLEDGLNWC